MAIKVSDLRHQIVIKEWTDAKDSMGGSTKTPSTVATCYAAIEQNYKPHEAWDSVIDGLQSAVVYLFTIRHRTGIKADMRVTWSGRTFEILAVSDLGLHGERLELLAVERY